MNPTLRKIYELCPAIAAWLKSDVRMLWPTKHEAVAGIQQYIGPLASTLYARSLHLGEEDTKFLQSQDAFKAIVEAIQAIYDQNPNFLDGLFVEESTAHA